MSLFFQNGSSGTQTIWGVSEYVAIFKSVIISLLYNNIIYNISQSCIAFRQIWSNFVSVKEVICTMACQLFMNPKPRNSWELSTKHLFTHVTGSTPLPTYGSHILHCCNWCNIYSLPRYANEIIGIVSAYSPLAVFCSLRLVKTYAAYKQGHQTPAQNVLWRWSLHIVASWEMARNPSTFPDAVGWFTI